MPRPGRLYFVPPGTDAHANASSDNTTDKETIAPPAWANACMISVETTDARVTFSGEDPGAGAAPGLKLIAGAQPVLFPFAHTIEFVSEAATASELNVLWLE